MEAAPVGQIRRGGRLVRRQRKTSKRKRLRPGAAPGWWDNHREAGELVDGMERRRLMVVGSEGRVEK